ncbi:hypothetical protein SAMN04488059_1662 [Devosia psychrophila]|uniref:Uncharacterized protein n=1 Tax=Devosia psychrophila TaxID=728005 RepID=A0A1I1SQP0_9HYPH|nr:hypothetical protein SAMN04488059_1662 [Devosia psychrophila]
MDVRFAGHFPISSLAATHPQVARRVPTPKLVVEATATTP